MSTIFDITLTDITSIGHPFKQPHQCVGAGCVTWDSDNFYMFTNDIFLKGILTTLLRSPGGDFMSTLFVPFFIHCIYRVNI